MRYKIDEQPTILGKFNTGDTVTITLYDLSDESSETLTSNACNELGATGVFYWSTSNITTKPTAFIEYCWVMTNGTTSQYGKIVLGGYPDTIADAVWDEEKIGHTGDLKIIADNLDTPVSSRLAAEDYVPPDNTAISGLPTLSEIEASTILAKEETLNTVRKLTSNRVKLENNQLLIYDDNCIDIIKTYNLFDEDGDPNLTEVYDRVPV
jgi:hypothetical protein